MNPGQVENIKKLINVTAILDSRERGEWLNLLDLMNDKQLFELEKILDMAAQNSPRPPLLQRGGEKAISPSASSIPKSASPPPPYQSSNSGTGQANPPHSPFAKATADRQGGGIKTVTSAIQPAVFAKPSFSHILNLPKFGNAKAQSDIKTPPLPKAENRFGAHLKEMLAEKELPPAEKSRPSTLQNQMRTVSPFPNPPKAEEGIRPGEGKMQVKLPVKPDAKVTEQPKVLEKDQPPTVFNIRDSTVIFGQKRPLAFQISETETKPPAPPAVPKPMPASDKPLVYSVKDLGKIGQKPPAPKVDAGINFVKPTEDFLSTIRPQTEPLRKNLPAKTGPLPPLNTLRDVAALPAEILQSNLSAAAGSLRKLAQNYGFHQVLFSLEQSPVYKLYINTGTKILNGQTTFGELATKHSDGYLRKEEFEQFTDLLREVQAGEK